MDRSRNGKPLMVITINNRNLKEKTKLDVTQAADLYAELNQDVRKVGILDREYRYYFLLTSVEVSAFLFSLIVFILSTNFFLVVLSTFGIGYYSVRFGGLIHDAGHRAIFKSPTINDIYGYIISATIAFPYYVWKVKHNLHHSNANEEGTDPDLEVPISFSENMFKREKLAVKAMRRYQAYLFFPLGVFVAFTMRLKALAYYLQNRSKKTGMLFSVNALMIFIWYVGPFIVFPFWKASIFFIGSNMVAGFYMLNVFAPNHKGMPQIAKGTRISFLERQIITARNIACNGVLDHLYMGLNYQIEHHLFPHCPRKNLGKISPFVRELCKETGLPYTQMSAISSTKLILNNLHEASEEFGS